MSTRLHYSIPQNTVYIVITFRFLSEFWDSPIFPDAATRTNNGLHRNACLDVFRSFRLQSLVLVVIMVITTTKTTAMMMMMMIMKILIIPFAKKQSLDTFIRYLFRLIVLIVVKLVLSSYTNNSPLSCCYLSVVSYRSFVRYNYKPF
jgi:hypothetical protein